MLVNATPAWTGGADGLVAPYTLNFSTDTNQAIPLVGSFQGSAVPCKTVYVNNIGNAANLSYTLDNYTGTIPAYTDGYISVAGKSRISFYTASAISIGVVLFDVDRPPGWSPNIAAVAQAAAAAVPQSNSINDFRVTLTSGSPITIADVVGATAIYLSPFKGNSIALYDGVSKWSVYNSSEVALGLGTLTNGIGYDVFAYNNNGAVALELLAWASATARATPIVRQDGVWVKSSDKTRRHVASFLTTSATTTENSIGNRYLSNVDNECPLRMVRHETASSWTYAAGGAIRQANANAANQVNFFNAIAERSVSARLLSGINNGVSSFGVSAIGLDSTTTFSTDQEWPITQYGNGPSAMQSESNYFGYPGIGKHSLMWNEFNPSGATATFLGTDTTANKLWRCGLFATING